jgi:hypothetical protein
MVHSERSLYRQVLVYEEAGTRCLCFTRGCTIGRQSCMELARPDRLVFDYTYMMLGSLLIEPRPGYLIIGLGGGTLPRALSMLIPGGNTMQWKSIRPWCAWRGSTSSSCRVQTCGCTKRMAARMFAARSGPDAATTW